MSDVTTKIALETAVAGVPEAVPHAPPALRGPWIWARTNLFASWRSTAVTLLLAFLIVRGLYSFVQWAFVNAVWWTPENQSQACRAVRGVGACWAVVTEKYRFILFATYPFDQQWRPALAITVFVMRMLGQTFNLMTLGAMAIAIGLVIDDAVVITENIARHLRLTGDREQAIRGVAGYTPVGLGRDKRMVENLRDRRVIRGGAPAAGGPTAESRRPLACRRAFRRPRCAAPGCCRATVALPAPQSRRAKGSAADLVAPGNSAPTGRYRRRAAAAAELAK